MYAKNWNELQGNDTESKILKRQSLKINSWLRLYIILKITKLWIQRKIRSCQVLEMGIEGAGGNLVSFFGPSTNNTAIFVLIPKAIPNMRCPDIWQWQQIKRDHTNPNYMSVFKRLVTLLKWYIFLNGTYSNYPGYPVHQMDQQHFLSIQSHLRE